MKHEMETRVFRGLYLGLVIVNPKPPFALTVVPLEVDAVAVTSMLRRVGFRA